MILIASTALAARVGPSTLILPLVSLDYVEPGRFLSIGRETLLVTERHDDDTVSVRRGQEGTAGVGHPHGAIVQILLPNAQLIESA